MIYHRTMRLRIVAEPPPLPVNTGVPTLLGTPAIGQTLSSTNGVWANGATSYAYQHQSSADGDTWEDIAGATAQTLLVEAALSGLYLRAGVKASNAGGAAEAFAYSEPVGPVSDASDKLVPSDQWGATGAAGSGFGGASPAAPVDPTRTTAKPMARLLNVPRIAFGEDLELVVDARAKGGVASVTGITEGGAEVTVSSPAFHAMQDINGSPTVWYGYKFTIDWAATMALNPLGRMRVYFTITANDETMQQRVIGPFEFSARNPGVGAGCVVDKQIIVAPSLSDIADVRYNTLTKARNRCVQHSKVNGAAAPAVEPVWEFPEIVLAETADYPLSYSGLLESFARENWTIVRAADGVSATIGDGSVNPSLAGWQYDGLCFRGSGVKWDLAKISPNLGGYRLRTNSNKLLWFDGCEVFCGENSYLLGSGSGMGALYDGVTSSGYWVSVQDSSIPNLYFTDVNAHDLPGYGLSFCQLIRGGVIDGVGGSTGECVTGLIQGHKVRRVGGILSGLRTYKNAMAISYTGGGTANLVITGNAGANNRKFQLFENSVKVLEVNLSSTTPAPSSTVGTTTKVSAVVAAVNATAGFSATETAQDRAAVFLTREIYQNAGPTGSGSSPPNNALVPLTSTPLQLSTWIDVHADAFVVHDMTLRNAIYAFNELEDIVGAAMVGLNSNASLEDVWISHLTSLDTSKSYGDGYSGGYISSASAKHFVMAYISQSGGVQTLGEVFTPDSYCAIDHCHLGGLGWSTKIVGPVPDLDITSLSMPAAALALPAGSDGNSKLQASGLDDGAFFTDISNPASPDFRPLSPLQSPDETWYGALLPGTGDWNGV